ncbi:MAG: hypothetical protein HQK76_06920 [Desulfobacterales bacterium]|nr:hypothetical protein [Desulfobacterales bacterium]
MALDKIDYEKPNSHSSGSFVTFDLKTKTLFTSDIFGSYSSKWELFLDLKSECKTCHGYKPKCSINAYCPLQDIKKFHRENMTSEKAFKYSLEIISKIPFTTLAPQHGVVLER